LPGFLREKKKYIWDSNPILIPQRAERIFL
jgi:hypothetical protein